MIICWGFASYLLYSFQYVHFLVFLNPIIMCYQRISGTLTFLGVGAIVFSLLHGATLAASLAYPLVYCQVLNLLSLDGVPDHLLPHSNGEGMFPNRE